jgi:hypothetical protein
MKPIKFKDVSVGSLFRICSERRPYYMNGERRVGMVHSTDRTVYKKKGQSHSASKGEAKVVILAGDDLVFPYTNPSQGRAR